MKNYLHRFRWWLGLKLLYREKTDARRALWDIMMCGLDRGPHTIEIAIEAGHNQNILIRNGARRISILLHHDQINVSPYAVAEDGESVVGELTGAGAHCAAWMLPFSPDDLDKLLQKNGPA